MVEKLFKNRLNVITSKITLKTGLIMAPDKVKQRTQTWLMK